MASFVGIVTRKEYKTGLTLRAKVTSPQGHSHAYQDFKCMVKPSGLSDLQCVLLDLASITNGLIAAGVIGVKSNLTKYMPGEGQNGTKVEYVVNGNVGSYIDNDGVIQQRPNYGTTDQTGTLTIIVTKGLESAERQINVSVAQYTQEEVVNSAAAKISWDLIRGSNAPESTDLSTDGRSNVMYKLTLPTSVNVMGSSTPVVVNWTVAQDNLFGAMGANRIDAVTGVVTRPAYGDVIDWIQSGALSPGLNGENYTITTLGGQNVVRLGGFKLTAEIVLGSAKQTITFNLKTLSALLTNQEVASYVLENIALSSSAGNQYLSTANTSSSIYTIEQLLSILLFTRTSVGLQDATGLFGLSNYKININTVNWSLVDSVDQTTPITLTGYTTGIQQLSDSNYQSIAFTALPTTTTPVPFTLKCTFEASGYDGNKVSISGYWKFQLKKPAV